jgi:hypothetical protein
MQLSQGRISMEQQVTEPTIKRLKPRAMVLMADQEDLEKIKDFIETLVKVKLVYVTSAPSNTSLRVVKEPRDKRQPFEQALFTLDIEN